MAKKKKPFDWAEAKKRCRLNNADIQMAKELGMTPKSLIKNNPSPKQQWKAPVKEWIHDLYEKKFGKVLENGKKRTQKVSHQKNESKMIKKENNEIGDDNLPF